jgi:hypothetical protein
LCGNRPAADERAASSTAVRRIEVPAAIGFAVAFVAGLLLVIRGGGLRGRVRPVRRAALLARVERLAVAAACLFGFTFVPLLVFAAWMLALGGMFTASQGD